MILELGLCITCQKQRAGRCSGHPVECKNKGMVLGNEMKFTEKLIANRMNVSFLLILLLMVSAVVFAASENLIVLIFPLVVAGIIIWWLIYSSTAKRKLIGKGVVQEHQTDLTEELEDFFKPESKPKKIFAAYGMTIGIFTVIIALGFGFAPDFLEKLFSSNFLILALFLIIMAMSYLVVKKKLK